MSYLVLARKWRPKTFEEVIGQESVVKTLVNMISNDRIPHALLFTGVRGVGKTTVARIFAKALNCDRGPAATPCNECANCKEISNSSSMDVMEIDGASNTSVNDVRELRETVRYLPSKSKYKIYIIDEVHMLSESAFNALLKTLEEPPDNVIFMFATTEPEQIPQTIISRTQRFDLRPISREKITASLKDICSKEKFSISDYSLNIIAREGAGSMRDALSLLDKIIAYGAEKISDEEVIEILGLIKRDLLHNAASNMIQRDAKGLMELVDEIFAQGYDPGIFLSEFLEYLRNLLILKVDSTGKLAGVSSEDFEKMSEYAGKISLEELQFIFDIIKKAQIEITRTNYQRFIIEMALLRSSSVSDLSRIGDIIESLRSGQEPENAPSVMGQKTTKKTNPGKPKENMAKDRTKELCQDNLNDEWSRIIAAVKGRKPYLAVTLEEAKPALSGNDLVLSFKKKNFSADMVAEKENSKIIKTVLKDLYSNAPGLKMRNGSPDAKGKAVNKALDILGGRIEGDRY